MVSALAAGLVLVLWYQFLYAPMNAKASKAKDNAQAAETKVKSLEAQLKPAGDKQEATDVAKKALETKLRKAITEQPALGPFIRQIQSLESESGVTLVSIAPSSPISDGSLATVNLGVSFGGNYAQATDFMNRIKGWIESGNRLIVVDSLTVSASGNKEAAPTEGAPSGPPTGEVFAGLGEEPELSVQFTARMFSEQGIGEATTGTGTSVGTGKTGAPAPSTPAKTTATPGVQTG